DTFTVSFSSANGSILSVARKDRPGCIWKSGEHGLWHVRFQDGSSESAAAGLRVPPTAGGADARAETGTAGSFECQALENSLRMTYRCPDLTVVVTATSRHDAVDFAAQVTPRKKAVLDFSLPARLRFDPAQVERFVCPMNGNFSVGAEFTPAFFREQSGDRPAAWEAARVVGPKGYISLYGGPLDQRADYDPPTALQVTAEGRKWFGDALAQRIESTPAVVNRPPTRAQAPLVLVDSANGPYLSANQRLWRVGGGVGEKERALVADMVTAVAARLAAGTVERRGAIGLLSLEHGPEAGGWAAVTVKEWAGRLSRLAAPPETGTAGGKVVTFNEIKTLSQLEAALAADNWTFILNPYGEWLPVLPSKDMAATVAAIGRYVRAGGNWIEVGGYPFFTELRPVRYLSYNCPYPPAFADFLHLDTANGSASLYGVQPQKWRPWEGAQNKEAMFVPGQVGCGADERGGYCERAFGTYVAPGTTWSAPAIRLSVGGSAGDDLEAYCRANEIGRRLEDKIAPDVLRKLKEAVLVYYGGNAKEKTDHLDLLPVPSLIHFADYLKGGFDKEYPDHLPPHAGFGTPGELRAFFDRAHQLGHLVSPYTNPTWWCDGPKGPTFEREDIAPLLKGFNGKPNHERYEANEGWTVCHWHPAVQAANRETVRQFAEDFPVDVLFQDQCGARTWLYDTNPASPTPYAYADGLVSQVAEDCQRKPLGTEAGWDRVVNYESQLCGLTFQIVTTEYAPSWRRLMKHSCPPNTWNVFPLAQRIAHDKTFMLHHDLGQFVTNREVLAWTLGLGFSLSYRVSAAGLTQDAPREWLKWLDRLQKSVVARYIGQPVTAFVHDRGPAPSVEDDGLIRATYGNVRIVANLGPQPRKEDGRVLAPYGFHAAAPGLVAANLGEAAGHGFGDAGVSFVVVKGTRQAGAGGAGLHIWVYAPAEEEVVVELPPGMATGSIVAATGDIVPAAGPVQEGFFSFRLPARPGQKRVVPPPELAGKAPRDWPERGAPMRKPAPPAIGVLDFGPNVRPAWTATPAQRWLDACGDSRLARELHVPVRRIATIEDLVAALKAGPTADRNVGPTAGAGRSACLAIINPYGEHFPAAAPGAWREMIALIRQYVNGGGSWWETGGYSFHGAYAPKDGKWEREAVGPAGLALLGVPVGGGEVDQAPEPLRVPAEGRAWLGEGLSARVETLTSAVNRGLPRGSESTGHVTLVAGTDQDFIGGYRLDG
ncbi:MAG: hypothetical protein NTW87_23030, partial [Planctomycetota bacterium]|nr:hypothetical protein [Planctomycetota bacterium]